MLVSMIIVIDAHSTELLKEEPVAAQWGALGWIGSNNGAELELHFPAFPFVHGLSVRGHKRPSSWELEVEVQRQHLFGALSLVLVMRCHCCWPCWLTGLVQPTTGPMELPAPAGSSSSFSGPGPLKRMPAPLAEHPHGWNWRWRHSEGLMQRQPPRAISSLHHLPQHTHTRYMHHPFPVTCPAGSRVQDQTQK